MATRGSKEWAENIAAGKTKHGDAKHGSLRAVEYRIWSLIIQRCMNKNNPAYESYGGRGIAVCNRWLKYENFLSDMGRRPSPKHSIDRKNNSKGYSKANCIWSLPLGQARNTRRNRHLTCCGRTQCLQAWALEVGISRQTICARLRLGWSVQQALQKPLRGS